jgi:hypothetical protein
MLFPACGLDHVLGACAVHTGTAALNFTNISLGLTALIAVAMIIGAVAYEAVSRARKGDGPFFDGPDLSRPLTGKTNEGP